LFTYLKDFDIHHVSIMSANESLSSTSILRPEKFTFLPAGWKKEASVDETAIRGCRLWQMMRDVIPGGRAALQELLVSCVADFKSWDDPEGAASVLKLADVLPHAGASLFFGKTDSPDLYLRDEVLKTLAYTSTVLDLLVATMAYREQTSAGNETTKCAPSPANDFLQHFPDLELHLLKEHIDNYTVRFCRPRQSIFHTFLHGSPGSGKSMLLNWMMTFAGLNGNPMFCYNQPTKTLTVYHPDGSIASVKFETEDVLKLNTLVMDMFDSQMWAKTPIVLWDPEESEQAAVPKYALWGPSFMATSNRAFLHNDHRDKEGDNIAQFHNILPWSEQEMVNLFSLTHSRSDVSRMYYYYGGSMRLFSLDLPRLPQYTAEMEHRLQDLECLATDARGTSDVSTFLEAVDELEELLVDLHLTDADAKADLELLRHYVSQDVATVPSSAYEIAMELMERVRRWMRQRCSQAAEEDAAEEDAAEEDAAEEDAAEEDAAEEDAAEEDAAEEDAIGYGVAETRLVGIVKKVVETMPIGELRMRRDKWELTLKDRRLRFSNRVKGGLKDLGPTAASLLQLLTAEGTGASKTGDSTDDKLRVALAYVVPDDKYSFLLYHQPHCDGISVRFVSPFVLATVAASVAERDVNSFLQVMNGLRSNGHHQIAGVFWEHFVEIIARQISSISGLSPDSVDLPFSAVSANISGAKSVPMLNGRYFYPSVVYHLSTLSRDLIMILSRIRPFISELVRKIKSSGKSEELKRRFFLGFPTATPRFDGCMVIPDTNNELSSAQLSFSIILVQQTTADSKVHSSTKKSREITHTQAIRRFLRMEGAHAQEPIRIHVLGTCYVHLKEAFSVSGKCGYPVDKVLIDMDALSKLMKTLSQYKSTR
jgi:hypothetical protein